MDRQGAEDFNSDQGQLEAQPADSSESSVLDLPDVRDIITESRTALQSELSEAGVGPVSAQDKALLDISQPDVTFGFLDTLHHRGIENLEIDSEALTNPRSALETVFESGDEALRELGFLAPDIESYRAAMEQAQSTGQDFHDVMSEMRAEQPLMMRQDLIPRDSIEFMDVPDTVGTVPEYEGPVAETQYDVHVMAYPLKSFELFGGISLETRDSHGFVVVTERGVDPLKEENALLVTRGGPDEATQTIFLPDSALPHDEQSPTEKTNSGNIYIANDEESRDDYDARGVFHIETYEVTHDLETIRDLVDRHRALINNSDIDYEVLKSNSNTYVGDFIELVAGQSSDFNHIRHPVNGGWRRLPAFENDLTDYSKTEFAENFGYEAPENETDNSINLETHNYNQPSMEETYDNGL